MVATANSFTVYIHETPDGKKYVGSTRIRIQDRFSHGKGYKNNTLFSKAIARYGWDNISHEVVAEGLTSTAAAQLEMYLIEKFHTDDPKYGFNKTKGGENVRESRKDNPAFAQKLKSLRLQKGYTQCELAKMINISQPSYWAYEKGEAIPHQNTQIQLAKVLGVTVEELMNGEERSR